MKVTSNRIVSTQGANKRPGSGTAKFSDGKAYDWMRLPDGALVFFTSRKTHGGTASSVVSFSSTQRANALEQVLS